MAVIVWVRARICSALPVNPVCVFFSSVALHLKQNRLVRNILRSSALGLRVVGLQCLGLVCLLGCVASVPAMIAEEAKMNVQQLRALGREGLIRLAVEEIRKLEPDFDRQAFDAIHVRGNEKLIRVNFEMNVQFIPQGVAKMTPKGPLRSAMTVAFTDHDREVTPHPRELYPCTKAARAALREAEAAGVPVRLSEQVRSIVIEDRGDSYLVRVRHPARNGYTGGSEQYRIDKQTKQRTMVWHEHPMKMPAGGISGGEIPDVLVEIP